MRRARRQIEANARVDSLLTAEVRSVPQIVERLGADRSLVRKRLQFSGERPGGVRRPDRGSAGTAS